MKKNTLLAIVVLVAVVVAFSLLPRSIAKKPPKPDAPTITLALSGDLVTVGSSCNGVVSKPGTAVEMTAKKTASTFRVAGPVAVWFEVDLTHVREHPLVLDAPRDNDFDRDNLVLPACLVAADILEVTFEDGDVVSVALNVLDRNGLGAGKSLHTEGFLFFASKVDGTLDSELRHFDNHTGKKSPGPRAHQETIPLGPLAIMGSHT